VTGVPELKGAALQGAMYRGECNWVLELDVQSYFDSLDRNRLWEMLRQRLADESFLRLIGKCVHVGVLDGAQYSEPDEGTAQGSVLSPMLGNIYLHHVLDLWFEHDVRPRMRGRAILVRYADDAVLGFERRDDAERVMAVLGKRMGKYGLSLHPEKTRLVSFLRPRRGCTQRKGTATFDFLGFSAAMLAAVPAGESPAGGGCPAATVVIPGGEEGDRIVGSPGVNVSVGWEKSWSDPPGRQATRQAVARANRRSPEMEVPPEADGGGIGSAERFEAVRRPALSAKELGASSRRTPRGRRGWHAEKEQTAKARNRSRVA